MSLEERRQSTPPSATTPPNTAKNNTSNQFKHQQTATSLDHRDTSEHQKSSPVTIQSCQTAISNSTLISQQQTEVMAMHNFGPNSSQHEHQLKNHQTDSGNDSSAWRNNNNNNSNINIKNESSPNTSNNDHVNDSQQSSVANNIADQRATVSDNSKSQSSNRSTLNRYQAQQHQPQSQSQQYHGIFSPQIPAILHKQLASRVDQVIRTTLNDSPAYTPPGRNESNAVNTTNVLTSTPSSNMPLQTSSSSLIFNTATGSMSNSSAPQNMMSNPQPNQGVGLMPGSVTNAPITSIYGSTLSNMGDNPISVSSSNLLAKTSPSHSALAAAAALQSLTQSHVQRSQQQQMAHTQPPPYTGISSVGSVSKPPSNGNGSPMPQAAHGGSIHQMPKFNSPSMAHSDQHNHSSFVPDQTNIGSLNFSSRIQPNNAGSSNLGPKITGPPGLSNVGWQEQIHGNNLLPRLPPLHSLNGPLPPYAPSSTQGSFGIMNPQLLGGPGSNNGNNMIGSDSDTLSKLNSMKSSPRQNNPMQFRDEKSFPMNFPTLMSNKQNQSNNDNLRAPQPNLDPEAAVQRGIMLFAYNLITHTVPGKPPKMLVHLDDELKKAIHNGEFYSKFGHIATGILSNHVYVPEFSIIDYLRKDRFSPDELENIRRINGTLTMPDLYYLMELVRQRPSDKGPQESGKLPPHSDISHINAGSSNSNCHPDHVVMSNLHHNSLHKSSSFLSSSPIRSDLIGPQGIDRSRRSSQSPSDISRSQLGNNTSNLKFMNAHNNIHQQVPPVVGPHQFTTPLCHSNQQQPHTSPQANRSSPFQPPLSVGSAHPLARPPRSHSTIVGLNMASFNPPFTPTSPQVRQPPAAHQSSSRPNLAGLDNYLTNPQTSLSSIPVTAHMSSKTPQTPKLQDSLPKPPTKSVQQTPAPFVTNKSMMSGHVDFQNSLGRFDLDSNHALSMPNRHQELADRENSKTSSGVSYLPSNMFGPGGNQSDLGRHHEILDGNPSPQMLMNHMLPGNYPINSRDSFNRSLPQSGAAHSGMPPPSMDHRQSTSDLSVRGINAGQGHTPCAPNESQMKQYNSLMGQFIMSGRIGENSPNSSNMLSQIPPYLYQPGSQMPPVGEPMHVDTMQQVKQSQGQTNSPKLNNQRSIITGSGTASTRKSKKAKPSPPAGASESKVVTSDPSQQDVPNNSLSDPVISLNSASLPSLSKYDSLGSGLALGSEVSPTTLPQNPERPEPTTDIAPCVSKNTSIECNSELRADIKVSQESCARGPVKIEDAVAGDKINLSTEKSKRTEPLNTVNPDSTLPKSDSCEINQSSKVEINTESKSDNINQVQNSTTVDQPSKYQYHKLFTKKAWLKNYDLEDQARLNGEVAATEDKMPVATRSSIKSEVDPDQTTSETGLLDPKPLNQNVKSNGAAKIVKTKADGKRKAKEGKSKKVSSVSALKVNKSAATTKNNENDSEGTNDSTSDPDDTDETDSLKSINDKKLRRMPRRKVKLNSDRESSDQQNHQNKTKSSKDSLDKDNVTKSRSKKEKANSNQETSCPTKRKYNSDDESAKHKTKKVKESTDKAPEKSDLVSQSKPKVGEKFLQTESCFEIVAKSIRCLECRRVRQPKVIWENCCRFSMFRKLRYNKSAQVVVAGFSEAGDAKDSDMQLWLPSVTGDKPSNMNYEVAKFILANIGDEFCKLVSQERAVLSKYKAEASDRKVIWKRAVFGMREYCDVCSTTLFNYHYVCDRCGFVICIDCHKTRAQMSNDADSEGLSMKKEVDDVKINCENNQGDAEQVTVSNKKSKKDSHGWIFCAKNEEHSPNKLTLTETIAANCLEDVWTMLHEIRRKLKLGQCYCENSIKSAGVKVEKFDENTNGAITIKEEDDDETVGSHSTLKGLLLASNDSPLNISADVKAQSNDNADIKNIDIMTTTESSTLNRTSDDQELDFGSEDDSRQVSAAIEGCIASLAADGSDETDLKSEKLDTNFDNLTSSRLCDGDLLVLTQAGQKNNTRLFRAHWRHGKPVLVRGIHNRMNIDMWLPKFFLGKFGDYRSDLVDCRNGDIHRQSMRKYWDGFEPSSNKKKPKEDAVPGHIPPANNEEPSAISTSYYSGSALWRLKDWPPGQDFNEILPEHYDDFMNNLPLKSYTTRTGGLNLASRLPKEMLKPDLGPKMYSAYGTTKFPERGTTNLHLDISDAINVLVYVGGAMPFKQGSSEYSEIYENTINDCHVDSAMKDQIRQKKLIPGALWHIFSPSDVPKIREFLNKMSDEYKISIEKRIDPIHDQTWYLDQNLLDRLQREYGVKSYPILQCMGDAILIPAGSPHQVKNLQNCIKVANDFVSPENIRSCLQLTDEFRNLPETHINQEDKLQIKNIMYHSVKESIQYIKMLDCGKVNLHDESSDEDDDSGDN